MMKELTRILSLPPKFEETVSISSCLWAPTETSQTDPLIIPPEHTSFQSSKHLSSSLPFLQHVCTLAPKPTNSSTIARLRKKKKKQSYPNSRYSFFKNKIKCRWISTQFREFRRWQELFFREGSICFVLCCCCCSLYCLTCFGAKWIFS